MKRLIAALILITFTGSVLADGTSDAFNAAKALGAGQNTGNAAGITTGTAATVVPNYTTTAPQSSYVGAVNLNAPSAAAIAACRAQATTDPQCQAMLLSQDNYGRRPVFVLSPTDPC